MLESLFRIQVQEHPGLVEHLPCYWGNNYDFLLTIALHVLEAERRCEARDGVSTGGARALFPSEGSTAISNGDCYPCINQGKRNRCNGYPFAHEKEKEGRPSKGRSKGRERSSPTNRSESPSHHKKSACARRIDFSSRATVLPETHVSSPM